MAGRKLKFKTPEEMQEAVDRYFESCKGTMLTDSTGQPVYDKYGMPIFIDVKPLTVTGLALALGFATRQSLLEYQARAPYKEIVEKAKLKIENYAEMRLYDKDGWNGAKFNLQNNFRNWDADKAAQDDKKGPAVQIICDIPRVSTAPNTEPNETLDPEAIDRKIKELEQSGRDDG